MYAETTRLIIRDLQMDDEADCHAFLSDPQVTEYMHYNIKTEADTREWLEAIIDPNSRQPRFSHNCGIVLRENGQVIGHIGIGAPSERKAHIGDYDFGYCLNRNYWGHGYMSEAVAALFKFAFTELDAATLFAECRVPNRASARVMEKVGMHLDSELVDDGIPHLRYIIRKDEWLQQIERQDESQ
jgi:[ribosomal protein S5]-alanine N-acetyltransferase